MNGFVRVFVRCHVLLYRLSGGRLGATLRGSPILILTTRGAKLGALRRVPITMLEEHGKLYVIAWLGGAPRQPAWDGNLKANPDVQVQHGSKRGRARANILSEPERTQVWSQVVVRLPRFAGYQSKTTRVIPVVELTLLVPN